MEAMSEPSLKQLFFRHALLPDGWGENVALDVGDGVIRAVATDASPEGREVVAGIALPGMPNVHSHAFQRGMAGLTERRGAGDDSFWSWRDLMYRFLRELTPEDVEALAAQAYVEMLEAGYTAVGEFHYLHHGPDGQPYANLAELSDRIVAAAATTGIGLTLIPTLYATGTFGGAPPSAGQSRFVNDADRFLSLVDKAREAVRRLPDGRLGVAPHSLRAVTPDLLRHVLAAFTEEPVHVHAAEQTREVEDCLAWSGLRPVEWLLEHAGLDGRWCVIHATHMTESETRRLAASGAVAGLCPLTEANLGDGIFNGHAFRAAGGRFAVGTDSNIEITVAGELKQLEYSQRLAQRARNALTLAEGESTGRLLYETAAAAGARALGRSIGALAPGRRADIVVLDDRRAEMAAVAGDRWLDQFVFVQGARVVDSVYVGGSKVVEHGRHRDREATRARFARVLARLAGA
jgi:formiminoglutamate deiminase